MAVPQEVICLQRSHFLSLRRSLEGRGEGGEDAAIGFNSAPLPRPPASLMSRAAPAEATAPSPPPPDVFPPEFKNE